MVAVRISKYGVQVEEKSEDRFLIFRGRFAARTPKALLKSYGQFPSF